MKVLVKYLLISILCLGICTPVFSQQAEKLFQQGMMKEEAEGNLEEAIDLYKKVVSDVSAKRSVRANALMHVGICYEKLGKGNALNAYQKIISEYGDQTDIVSLARKKIQSLKSSTNTKLSTGLISERLEKEIFGEIWLHDFSPDGKHYLYLNSVNNVEEIMICNIQTGKKDSITTGNRTGYGFDNTQPWGSKWAPNGMKIAFNWGFWGKPENPKNIREIHLVDKNGENKQVILSGPEGKVPVLQGFTHDSKNLIGTLLIQENDQKKQELVLISIANKNFKTLKNFGVLHAKNFSYSPDGNYLLYEKLLENSTNKGIYVMSMANMKESLLTNNTSNNWNPLWSHKGDEIVFLSNRIGSNGLYKINFEDEKSVGKPQLITTNLGEKTRIMGVSNDGNVFYEVENGRRDIYTMNLDEKFKNDNYKINQITNPVLKSSGGYPRYSKDGRYISYMGKSNVIDPLNKPVDHNLGRKYYINIYDTKTRKSRLLNLDLYMNNNPWVFRYYVPNWSYHENKLLVHGRVKNNYEGGFYTVDVLTEEITPILTVPNCKQGTDYKIFGNSMRFSKSNKDKIFYSSKDWKDIMEYNIVTKEEKAIIHIEDGAWFEGFLDDAETKCITINRFGKFISDVNTKETVKIGENTMGWSLGTSQDKKYYYYMPRGGGILNRVPVNGNEQLEQINIKEYFQNSTSIIVDDLHPTKNEVLLSVDVSSGVEIHKLTNVFE